MIHYCPNCQIGLNNQEMKSRFCQNCKHNWSEEDEDIDEELMEPLHDESETPKAGEGVEPTAEWLKKFYDELKILYDKYSDSDEWHNEDVKRVSDLFYNYDTRNIP